MQTTKYIYIKNREKKQQTHNYRKNNYRKPIVQKTLTVQKTHFILFYTKYIIV
jgi:hypothetical protein